MPVSTRSKISTQNDRNPTIKEKQRLRNPHHGLKDKLKTLTLLYEQQKQAFKSLRNTNTAMRERNSITNPNSTITKTFILPQPPSSSNNDDDAKENQNLIVLQDRIVGFSYPRKVSAATNAAASVAVVARRLSMPASVKEKDGELGKCVSMIMVFVRVRPMNKKEIELGSRYCEGIVNQRDVYLTESANEKDYLRLNRVKGRHFTFDGSFTDKATQLQVYSTTLYAIRNLNVYVVDLILKEMLTTASELRSKIGKVNMIEETEEMNGKRIYSNKMDTPAKGLSNMKLEDLQRFVTELE